ncbi:capsular biosynthesis protein [Paenibacillus yonginensis]|uniref:Capsular biosynthesis protein n=1 Tax=Paenibacillus yonginensis TaxID=1462996 RepID=A0A1B1MVS9_9BACL|nr:Wzz/FepE/Etk N-terminal domain-containing protein [Paenibacillus yonginensis]ANS73292.1 capsular biosynthesis protein [Paenibacillus yonginensis]
MEKTILDYVHIIQKKLWIIFVFVLIACATTYYVSKTFVTPVYAASGQLIVNSINPAQGSNNLNDLNTSLNLVQSYKEIMESPKILGEVVTRYPELGLTEDELAKKLEVKVSEKSQVMNLKATDESYSRAAGIVNAVSATFIDAIPSLMNLNNVKLLTSANAEQPGAPVNGSVVMNLLISFVVSLMVAIGVILFLESINDTVRTEKEAEEWYGVPVIASVPMMSRKQAGKPSAKITGRVEEPSYAAFK